MGKENAFDTVIPLEWDETAKVLAFPLLDHEWAELRGLLSNDGDERSSIPKTKYHIERDHRGCHRIIWVGESEQRPLKVYGLVAVHPKPPGVFLGIPIPILTPVVAAFAGALVTTITMLFGNIYHDDVELEANEVCNKSANWISSKEHEKLKKEYDDLLADNIALKPYESEYKNESKFVMNDVHGAERVVYLIGKSHGLRLEAIKRLFDNKHARDIALDAETTYVTDALVDDSSSAAFTKGKGEGQLTALRLLGLGMTESISGNSVVGMGGAQQ